MQQIEFGFSHGYTSALLRVKETICQELADDLKRHQRRFSVKEISTMLDAMIADREKLRENPFAFVRCNGKGWEVYEPRR